MNRPNFKQLLEELEHDSAEWDAIICYKLSRMSRSVIDGLKMFDLLEKKGKCFVSATEPLFDFSTPIGRAVVTILQAINQMEREQTAENTKNKMISIASSGCWPVGIAPYGYKRGEKGDNVLHIDPLKAEHIRDIFTMYLSDKYTTMDILKKYPAISKSSLLYILANRVYLGRILYAGKEYAGKHTAIISQDLFDAVAQKRALAGRSDKGKPIIRENAQNHPYLLTGLLYCHCGRFMTPGSAKSGQYHYYSCTDSLHCKNRIRAEKIEKSAIEAIRNYELRDEVILEALRLLEERKKTEAKESGPELKIAMEQLEYWQNRQDKIAEALIDRKLSAQNEIVINAKMDAARKNIETLSARIEYLRSKNVQTNIFKEAKEILLAVKSIKDAILLNPADTTMTKAALHCYVKSIKESSDGRFRIQFNFNDEKSSSKGTDWLRQ